MQELVYGIGYGGADHGDHLVSQVPALQHLLALFVNDRTLLIHYIVVRKHIFTPLKVLILKMLLGAFYGI